MPGTPGTTSVRASGTPSTPASPTLDVLTFTASQTGWHPIVVYRESGVGSDESVAYDFGWTSSGALSAPDPLAQSDLEFLGATPNPVAGQGSFEFVLPAPGSATLALYDLGGRRVRSLADGVFGSGHQSVAWDGRDESGARLGAGMYWARFESAGRTLTRPVVLTH